MSPISIIYLALLTYSAIYLKTHNDFSPATFGMLIQTVNEKVNCYFTVLLSVLPSTNPVPSLCVMISFRM
jgi:hypothetical protein